jgi:hypothetical protein
MSAKKSLLNSQDYTKSFWTLHPDLKTVPLFRKQYDADKSIGKMASSRFMWMVALTNDYKSMYHDMADYGKHGKFTILSQSLFGDPEYYAKNSKKFEECIEMYRSLSETKLRRSLRVWEEKLNERDQFLEATPFTGDSYDEETGKEIKGNTKMLDEMLKNTKQLFEHYKQIYDQLMVEEGKAKGSKVTTQDMLD